MITPFEDDANRSADALASFFSAAVSGGLPHMDPSDAASLAAEISRSPKLVALTYGMPGADISPGDINDAIFGEYSEEWTEAREAERRAMSDRRLAHDAAEFADMAFDDAGFDSESAGRALFDASMGDSRAVDAANAAFYFA